MLNLLDLEIKEFGYEIVIKNKRFSYTTKDYPLIHFVVKGEGYFEINKRKYNLKRGGLFYIPAHCEANYYPNPNNPWEYIWVGFDGLKAEALLELARLDLEHPIYASEGSAFNKIMSDLYSCYNEENENRDLLLVSIMYRLFYQLSLENANLENKKIKSRVTLVSKAKEYISNNYQFDIKVADIAKDISITPEYLSAIFKEVEGISTIGFLKNIRLNVALSYLDNTTLKINEISKRCGYKSPLYFSNDFKKYYGVSPLEYIKQKREINHI